MGNVNNCLSNPFEYEEIKLRPERNVVTNKTFNNFNSKNIYPRAYLYNKQKLDIINEEDIQETKSQLEKQPKDGSSLNKIKENNSLISTPKDIKLKENKFNSNFNNNFFKNNNQDVMILDNNVLFNSTRKSNNNQTNINNYNNNININGNNNEVSNNINNSHNNCDTNKLANSLDESDNLIVLEYNRPEGTKINENINNKNSILNQNINTYNNNDNLNDKDIKNQDNIKKIHNNICFNEIRKGNKINENENSSINIF